MLVDAAGERGEPMLLSELSEVWVEAFVFVLSV
jgi:hypothetical protein